MSNAVAWVLLLAWAAVMTLWVLPRERRASRARERLFALVDETLRKGW